jgi:GNAT superfamily N-acetyltransferase
MDEIPLYWWDGYEEGEANCALKLNAARRQLQKMITRDFNHPSVIFWSVSNETDEMHLEVAEGNQELVRLAKSLDATRLATHVSNRWQQHPCFENDDVISVNAYPSWCERICDGNFDYELSQATEFWRKGLDTLHAQYPHKPILVTEFGYTSLMGVTGSAYGEDTHADVLAHEFAGMDAPYVCGATVWCWADHPWPAATFDFANHLGISPFGVVTRDRRKLQPFWTIRSLFREKHGIQDPPPVGVHEGEMGYSLMMVRPTLDNIPQFAFPEGYSIRPMQALARDGADEAGVWADIWRDAEGNAAYNTAVFHKEFGTDYPATQWRCYFVLNENGVAVGTISAWYNRRYKGQNHGQIHWVALRRSVWGKGLGKAMLTYTLTQMAQWHERAFLGTQSKRLAALKLYLDFGFMPDMDEPGAVEGWREVKAKLKHPSLESMSI